MVAVHALVPAADVWRLLPELEAAGASSILLVPVERMLALSAGRRASAFRPISSEFAPYGWAPSTAEHRAVGRRRIPSKFSATTGTFRPTRRRSQGPVPWRARSRRSTRIRTVATARSCPRSRATRASAPENIVLGAGADDLILLCARAFAGPGDLVDVLDEPTYPMFRVAAYLAGAEVGEDDPALTFCCRPHNPTGASR